LLSNFQDLNPKFEKRQFGSGSKEKMNNPDFKIYFSRLA